MVLLMPLGHDAKWRACGSCMTCRRNLLPTSLQRNMSLGNVLTLAGGYREVVQCTSKSTTLSSPTLHGLQVPEFRGQPN